MIAYSHTQRNVLTDEFTTPVGLIEACFQKAILPYYADIRPPEYILDVGANDGRWGKTARKYFPNAHITGIEIMNMPKPEGFDRWFVEDWINVNWFGDMAHFDLIIGNPPYRVKEQYGETVVTKYKAEDFVRKGMALLKYPNGLLAFLLRTNFRHSLERAKLFKVHPLYQVFDCMLRPSFYREDKRTEQYSTKATNEHDYALFMWMKSWTEKSYMGTQLEWEYSM